MPGLGAAPQELTVESRVDVAREDATADYGDIGGSMGGGWQQGEAVHGGSLGGAEVASCFPEPELQIESRADVNRLAVRARQVRSPMGNDQLGDGGNKARAMRGSVRRRRWIFRVQCQAWVLRPRC